MLCINASKRFEPLHILLLGRVDPGLAIVERISNHHLRRRIYQFSPARQYPVISSILIRDTHLLLVLRVGNKKLTHIFEGDNIATQSSRSISPDRYVDFRLQPAAGSASTSRVAPACRMDSVSAQSPRSSCCCKTFHCFRWCPTPARKAVLPRLRKENWSRFEQYEELTRFN